MQNLQAIFGNYNTFENVLPGNIASRSITVSQTISSFTVALPNYPSNPVNTLPKYNRAGRLALGLTENDKGVKVFDTDYNAEVIWDGEKWLLTSKIPVLLYNDGWEGATIITTAFTPTTIEFDWTYSNIVNITPYITSGRGLLTAYPYVWTSKTEELLQNAYLDKIPVNIAIDGVLRLTLSGTGGAYTWRGIYASYYYGNSASSLYWNGMGSNIFLPRQVTNISIGCSTRGKFYNGVNGIANYIDDGTAGLRAASPETNLTTHNYGSTNGLGGDPSNVETNFNPNLFIQWWCQYTPNIITSEFVIWAITIELG